MEVITPSVPAKSSKSKGPTKGRRSFKQAEDAKKRKAHGDNTLSNTTTPIPENIYKGKEVYCICRKPDDGTFMVGCEDCNDWFHGKCVGIKESEQGLLLRYICPNCKAKHVASGGDELNGETKWRRKCRLIGCMNPVGEQINGRKSKFCCKDHGLLFFRKELFINGDINKPQKKVSIDLHDLSNVVKHTSFKRFKLMGHEFPQLKSLNISTEEDERLTIIRSKIHDLQNQSRYNVERQYYLSKTTTRTRDLNQLMANKHGVKKKDVCGFDSRLWLNFEQWEAWYNSPKGKEVLQSCDWPISEEVFNSALEKFENGDVQEEGGFEAPLDCVCLKEKRKCLKHTEWQNVILNDCLLNSRAIAVGSERLEAEKKAIIKKSAIKALEKSSKHPHGTVISL